MTATDRVLDELLAPESRARLKRLAADHAEAYRTAEPFPHIAIDDFLPAGALRRAVEAFPREEGDWEDFEGKQEKKRAIFEAESLAPPMRDLLYFLNSAPVLKFLEGLTGIEGLIPDPHYFGGGLHEAPRGGFLEIHADFNLLHTLNLQRRINLLVYLNEDWEEDYGGHLELWDPEMTRCFKRVLPAFNRCLVFNTTDTSYHGNPHPLTCPEGRARRSAAIYYYTVGRGDEAASEWHTTIFKQRPGGPAVEEDAPDVPTPAAAAGGAGGLKHAARRVLPPFLHDALRRLAGRAS